MKISTGTRVLDGLLEGGYETGVVTTIYGPSGSGKTNFCLIAMAPIVRKGKRIIYIDTEASFSVERLKQIYSDYKKILENVLFIKPTNFKEQKRAFERLRISISDKIGLVVIDTISMLYRLELSNEKDVYNINRDLGKQLSMLVEIARKRNIPVLVTNQVYANFDERDKVNMVGGDILKYSSKCLIELQIAPNGKKRAILKKHRSIGEKEVLFEIKNRGIFETRQGKGFRLF